jgi:molybdopterin/thiamine biosynthesis adenylyltransferase
VHSQWSCEQAYSRNEGLINKQEQRKLLNCLVAIPGCGGIGSTVAETLARLGVGKFRLCDPDTFDVANINRQLGATTMSLNQNKAEAVRDRILTINPTAVVEIFHEPISKKNADRFVFGCDLILDGIDFYAIEARRALFQAARDANLPAMTAAPLGFSATLQVYLPSKGMSFDEFFNFLPEDSYAEQILKFLVGLAPKGLQRSYMDLSIADGEKQTGPSSIIGTQLAAAMIGGEAIRVLLKRGSTLAAPWYRQFDAYKQQWVKRYLWGGNKHPLQRFKLVAGRQMMQKIGLWQQLVSASVN